VPNMTDAIRAVVFDMDGLMFNTEDVYTQCGSTLLRRRGHEFDTELKNAMMGIPARLGFEIMIERHQLDDTAEQLLAESNAVFLEIVDSIIQPLPGLMQLLDTLEHHELPKAIATSTTWTLARPCLEPFGFLERFEFVLTGDDFKHGKPHPEVYLTAAERLGLPPEQILVLEDSQNGCRSAASAGTFAVAVPGEHSQGHDFSGARMVIDSLEDQRLYDRLAIERPAG
jgi:HAD superfamily hydrolase (TIGR01509 family)